jgi:hypothetical protein
MPNYFTQNTFGLLVNFGFICSHLNCISPENKVFSDKLRRFRQYDFPRVTDRYIFTFHFVRRLLNASFPSNNYIIFPQNTFQFLTSLLFYEIIAMSAECNFHHNSFCINILDFAIYYGFFDILKQT